MDVVLQGEHAGKNSVRLALTRFVVMDTTEHNRRSQVVTSGLDFASRCPATLAMMPFVERLAFVTSQCR